MVIFVILATLFFVFGIPYLVSSITDPTGTSKVIDSIFKKEKKYNIQDEMNFFDDAKWVEKVINSCNTLEQLYVCDELIKTLIKKYKNKVNPFDLSLIDDDLNSQWLLKSRLI